MNARTSLFLMAVLLLAGCPASDHPLPANPAPPPQRDPAPRAVRTADPAVPAPLPAKWRWIEEIGGVAEQDAAGRLIAVDVARERVTVTDAELALLAAAPSIERLRAAGGGISNAGAEKLVALENLVELALRDAQIDAAGLAALARLPELRALDLRGCGQINAAALAECAGLERLESLKLGGYAIDDRTLESLGKLPKLRSLAVEDCSVTAAGLKALQGLPLEELTLFRCWSIDDDALAPLAAFDKLRQLTLRDMPIRGGGLVHLHPQAELRTLNVSQTMLGDAALARIAAIESLTRLELHQTQITDEGLAALAPLASLEPLEPPGLRPERRGHRASRGPQKPPVARPHAQCRCDRCQRRYASRHQDAPATDDPANRAHGGGHRPAPRGARHKARVLKPLAESFNEVNP